MDINRRTAFEALLEVDSNGAYSNLAAAAAIEKYRPDNEAFVRTLIYGTLENQIYIDHRLDQLIRTGLKKVRPQARILLRMGAFQIEFMNSVPDYAAINETVRIVKKVCRGLDGFVNGVLRAYSRGKGKSLPDPDQDPAEYLSIKYSYARDIVDMWLEMYGREETEALLAAGNQVPALSICVNTEKTTAEKLAEYLALREITTEPVHAESLAGQALNASGSGLLATKAFQDGQFYVQDTASMLAVSALDPQPGDTVIDVCSAPGGKSFFAALKMKNRGHIISCDIYDHKMELIRGTASRLGIDIIETRRQDGREFCDSLNEIADCVIVDAPCSGLGVVRRRPEIKLKARRDSFEDLAALQLEILTNAAGYVKPGGKLMYSTCTVSNIENEGVIEKFLEKNTGFSVLSKKQLLPNIDQCDGFYFCVMEKI